MSEEFITATSTLESTLIFNEQETFFTFCSKNTIGDLKNYINIKSRYYPNYPKLLEDFLSASKNLIGESDSTPLIEVPILFHDFRLANYPQGTIEFGISAAGKRKYCNLVGREYSIPSELTVVESAPSLPPVSTQQHQQQVVSPSPVPQNNNIKNNNSSPVKSAFAGSPSVFINNSSAAAPSQPKQQQQQQQPIQVPSSSSSVSLGATKNVALPFPTSSSSHQQQQSSSSRPSSNNNNKKVQFQDMANSNDQNSQDLAKEFASKKSMADANGLDHTMVHNSVFALVKAMARYIRLKWAPRDHPDDVQEWTGIAQVLFDQKTNKFDEFVTFQAIPALCSNFNRFAYTEGHREPGEPTFSVALPNDDAMYYEITVDAVYTSARGSKVSRGAVSQSQQRAATASPDAKEPSGSRATSVAPTSILKKALDGGGIDSAFDDAQNNNASSGDDSDGEPGADTAFDKPPVITPPGLLNSTPPSRWAIVLHPLGITQIEFEKDKYMRSTLGITDADYKNTTDVGLIEAWLMCFKFLFINVVAPGPDRDGIIKTFQVVERGLKARKNNAVPGNQVDFTALNAVNAQQHPNPVIAQVDAYTTRQARSTSARNGGRGGGGRGRSSSRNRKGKGLTFSKPNCQKCTADGNPAQLFATCTKHNFKAPGYKGNASAAPQH